MMKKMVKRLSIVTAFIIAAVMMAAILPSKFVQAYDPIEMDDEPEIDKKNPDTGYRVVIYDGADLLTSSEIKQLAEDMAPITEFGDVAMITTEENSYNDTQRYAEKMLQKLFGNDDATLFIIDMQERYIWIQSYGSILKAVNTSYANDITDNCYKYASREDYYGCASSAFEQIYRRLNGQIIARPMKIVCSAFLALLFSFLFNFFFVNHASKIQNTSSTEMLTGAKKSLRYTTPRVIKTGETKTYSPQSSGSSGGGGGSRGGGGGGGHHGGGGGHRF